MFIWKVAVGPILQEVPAGQIVKDAGPKGAEMTSLAVGEDASTAPAQNTPLPAEKIKFVQENMAKCQKRVQGQMTECQKLLVVSSVIFEYLSLQIE
jgi:hypothetical protein